MTASIEIGWSTTARGRGVFATSKIGTLSIIESCPVVLIPTDQIREDEQLMRFVFEWSSKRYALALGLGSLYNHSFEPNAVYGFDHHHKRIVFKALRDIFPTQEIFINYNGDPECQDSDWLPFRPKKLK